MAVTPFNSRLGYSSGLTGYIVIDELGGISATNASFNRAIFINGITAPNVVYSINGATGAVTLGGIGGICTGTENTFTARQNFAAGISASGATFTGNISAPNVPTTTSTNTFTPVQLFGAGLSAAGATFTGPVVIGGTFSFGRIMDTTGNNRVIQNSFKIVSKTGLTAEIFRFDKTLYNIVDIISTANVIDTNTSQGSWPSEFGPQPEQIYTPGFFIGRKDLIVQDGTYTDSQTYVTALVFSSSPTTFVWSVTANVTGNDCIVYIAPMTRQTTIFTGHYTLTPLGLTG
jgi:hypothetical protein